jgi:hypothetical protein
MRYVSMNMRAVLQGTNEEDDVGVLLATITHPSFEAPVRYSTDNKDLISIEPYVRGTKVGDLEYIQAIRGARLPESTDISPRGELVINDLDGSLARAVRTTAPEPATISMVIVRAAAPEIVEIDVGEWEVAGVTSKGGTLALEIAETDRDEPFPAHRMSKLNFPGLFR